MQLKQDIKTYLIENFYYGQDDNTLTDDISFLENGIIDSTGVLELVSFIQEKYGITVSDEEILPDNFDSINKLAGFIMHKTAIPALQQQ
jgi:acyl carrier protein